MSGAAGIRVREARPPEHAAIRELTLRAYAEYATVMEPPAWAALERALHAALATEAPVERIVAERNGGLVGSVHLFPAAFSLYESGGPGAGSPELRLLAVAPEARGMGVGAALVEECVRRARRAGAAAIGLHTSRSMGPAVRMYERMGFVRDPEHDFQPPGAELVQAYRRDLGEEAAAG